MAVCDAWPWQGWSGPPEVGDGKDHAFGFGWRVVAEDVGEERAECGVKPVGDEAVAVGFGLPDIDVAQTALGALQGQVADQPRGEVRAECLHQPIVEGSVDGHILGERIGHGCTISLERPAQFDRNHLPTKVRPMQDPVKRRRYDTTGRRRQSAETRRRILDAARARIVEHGYRASPIRAIAADAEVSVATVYELVGRKPDIVRELVELALSGAERPVPGSERDYVAAMRAEVDASAQLDIYAAAITAIQGRLAPLFLALRDAATTEPEAAEVWATVSRRRADNMTHVAADLAATGQLRPDLTIDGVADTLWALNSPEMYVLLTTERGWTPERFRHWLADTWQHVLLAR